MSHRVNLQWRLGRRPDAHLNESHFNWHEEAIPDDLDEGHVLVRTLYLSLDPTNRIWASDMDQYMPPVRIGDVMRGANLGVVEDSRDENLPVGSIVSGMWGWQSYYCGRSSGLQRIEPIKGIPLSAYISVLGINGMTAYYGLFDVGNVRPSDTVVVSAAAGSVGSLVGQMARLEGCRVIGIAGSPDKCDWLTDELGFDAAVDYKSANWQTDLQQASHEGVDFYFDNVGGDVSDAVLERMNTHGRVAVCGMISRYNEPEPWSGPANYGLILMRCLTIRGFLVSDYFGRLDEGQRVVGGWLAEGRLKYRLDIVDGLDHAPTAIDRLFDGKNSGKLLVQCSDLPDH